MHEATPRVLGKGINVILALAKRNIEHELSLWGWLKPKRGKTHRRDLASVHKIDQSSAVHAVAGEAVGMPRQDAHVPFMLDALYHVVENWTAGLLRRLFLNEFADDLQSFSSGELAQF